MFLNAIKRILYTLLLFLFIGLGVAVHLIDLRVERKGVRIGSFSLGNVFSCENVFLRYDKEYLFVDVDTAYIRKGVLDYLSSERIFQKIGFSIKNGFFKGDKTIQFSLNYPPESALELNLEQKLDVKVFQDQTIELLIDYLGIDELKSWIKEFYDHPSLDWISQGILYGKLKLDPNQMMLNEGELFLENIQGGDLESGSKIAIKKIKIRSDQKIEVEDGSVRVNEPKNGYDFGVENLSGLLHWTMDQGVFFSLEGLLRQGLDSFPLFLEGCKGSDTIFEADASLMLDQGQNLKRYFHISLENPSPGKVILKGLFDHVVESELNALKQLFKPNVPELEIFQVESMQARFEMQGVWENGHLVSISVEDIFGEFDVSFHSMPTIRLIASARYAENGILIATIQDLASSGQIQISLDQEKTIFHGFKVSDQLLNSVLTPFRDGWFLAGEADINGRFEKNQTKVHISSQNLTFFDHNIEFCLTKKGLEADFLILEDQNIQGILDCQGGELKISGLHKDPLVFCDLSSRISIFNDDVYLDEIQTTYLNTLLEGNLSLRPISIGGKRLHLYIRSAEGPLKDFREWISPLDQFVEGSIKLDSKGFILEADLIENGSLNYEMDLKLQSAAIGDPLDPFCNLDVEFYHSTWTNKSLFQIRLGIEAVDWFRLSGQLDDHFFTFDPKKTHLFQKPLKQIQGGKKEGGMAFELEGDDLDAVAKILRLKEFLPFKKIECFVGFRDFASLIAGTIKLDQQELSFLKENSTWTLKKGGVKFANTQCKFEDVRFNSTHLWVDTDFFHINHQDFDFKLKSDQGLMTLIEGKLGQIPVSTQEPVKISFDWPCIKIQGGSLNWDLVHRLWISSLQINLLDQQILLKSSKVEVLPEIFSGCKALVSGWVRGEWGECQKFLEYKMTPISTSLLGQTVQIHKMDCFLHPQGFKMEMDGKLDHLHFKGQIQTFKKPFERFKIFLESDLGHAFFDIEKDKEVGWFLHESKGDLIGLVWSILPTKTLKDKEKIFWISSLTMDPSLFIQGLKTFKIPIDLPYQIEKPIYWNGNITLFRDFSKAPLFEGSLHGKNLKFEGIHCRNMSLDLFFEEGQLFLKKIRFVDPAYDLDVQTCNIQIETLDTLIEGITLTDLRPTLLKPLSGSKKDDPFVVKEMVIPSLYIKMQNGFEMKGKGELFFVNQETKRKNILDLPWDILSVLGLDPSLLVPVCGQLEFTFDRNKIFIDRLRRSYSDKNRSTFFLDPKTTSYVGLDGTLFIRLRMKQSVILRLAEPFVIAIDGNLLQPSFKLK
ncbi:MAG: hypothetical protein EB053_04220 [Chlamydiae bacterium]|nr:hypothetical protein [Chlamydiota bacterium]